MFGKKKKTLPIQNRCRNCDTQLISRYCHNCGQDLFAGTERSVKDVMSNTFETVFAWDNQTLVTLKYLLFCPGKLTNEFFAGKVMQYVHPAKLFWFASFLFFATSINLSVSGNSRESKEKHTSIQTPQPVEMKQAEIAPLDNAAESVQKNVSKDTSSTQKKKVKKLIKEVEHLSKEELLSKIDSYKSYIAFVLIPFFAFLLHIFFYKRKRYYVNHVIFALHFHAFIFLLCSLLTTLDNLFPPISAHTDRALIYLPPVYFAIALHNVYQPGIRKMLWKVPCIMLLYGIMTLITGVVFVVLVAMIATGNLANLMNYLIN